MAELYDPIEQICWTCKNVYSGCSWAKEFKPVDGWVAIRKDRKEFKNGKARIGDGYRVRQCPEYLAD